MLCSTCQDIFEAKSERIYVNVRWNFKHHDSLEALKASAEMGCNLCSMIWCQVPDKIRDATSELTSRQADEEACTSRSQPQGPITYTTDEILRRDGKYILDFYSQIDQTVSNRMYLMKIEDISINEVKLPMRAAKKKSFRLLEINPDQVENSLRLRDCGDIPSHMPYLTLSHCWGGIKIKCLTRDSLQTFREKLDVHELPQTFQDTINLVQRLGHQYLWIDSLCIIQDDPEDWKEQAALMADIYQGSWCNIAATSALNSTHGLFGLFKRIPTFLKPLHVQVKGDEAVSSMDFRNDDDEPWLFKPHPRENEPWPGYMPGLYEVLDREMWYRNVSDSPLGHRAWIVQERLLAPRVLHFAKDQLFWECNELKACELYPFGLPDRADLLSSAELKSGEITSGYDYPPSYATAADWNDMGPSPLILQSWNDIVEVYTKANLTYDSDKLIAIDGLANYFQGRIRADYLAGIWGVHLHRQILWSIKAPTEPLTKRTAPTWCWASVNGEVTGAVDIDDHIERRLATILDFNMQGEIFKRSGTLWIHGRLIPCTLSVKKHSRLEKQCSPTVRGLDFAAFVLPDISVESDTAQYLFLSCSFFCVPTLIFRDATEPTTPEVTGLVLASTDQKGVFQRFGVFRTDNARDRDGDLHPDWIYDSNIQPRRRTQFGRVFLMDVEDEQAEVEERFYERYERNTETSGFGNFVFSVI